MSKVKEKEKQMAEERTNIEKKQHEMNRQFASEEKALKQRSRDISEAKVKHTLSNMN